MGFRCLQILVWCLTCVLYDVSDFLSLVGSWCVRSLFG